MRVAGDLSPSDALVADICIIGGGPAGLSVADALVGSGASVLLLEAGGTPARPSDVDDARARSTGHPYFPVHTTRVRGLAGTSNHWYHDVGFRARRLDDVDFEARVEVPHSGWPFGRTLLDPFYDRADVLCGLGDTAQERPASDGPELLDLGPDVVTSTFRLVPTDPFQRLGARLLSEERLRTVLHATVTELVLDADGAAVRTATVRTDDGQVRSVTARAWVLAAGGIDNARLLLASTSRHPAGVGNGHDLVGRFFMEHLSVRSGEWRFGSGALRPSAAYQAHDANGVQWHLKLSPAQDVVRRRGLLNTTFFVDPMDEARASAGTASLMTLKHALVDRPLPSHLGRHLSTAVRHLPAVAAVARRQLAQRRGVDTAEDTLVQLRAMSEQAPNPLSRITLDSRRDRHGVPRPVLDWRLTDLDRRSVRAAQDVLDAALQAAGAGQLDRKLGEEQPPAEQRGQWHHMGTTRMHPDPRQGVVDADGRVHGLRNLFVAGSSVFPTGGYANPTLTLVALALRLADHLRVQRWPS